MSVSARSLVRRLETEKDSLKRRILVRELGRTGSLDCLPFLYYCFITDPDWYVRKAILDSMRPYRSRKSLEIAILSLADEDPEVRSSGINLLKKHNFNQMHPVFVTALRVLDTPLKAEILKSLFRLKETDPHLARDLFREACQDTDEEIRKLARSGVRKSRQDILQETLVTVRESARPAGLAALIIILGTALFFLAGMVSDIFFPGAPEQKSTTQTALEQRGLMPSFPGEDSGIPSPSFSVPRPVLPLVKGDLDGDGQVTGDDAWMAKQHLLGLESIPDDLQSRADIDGDGTISSEDISAMFLKIMNVGDLDGDGLVDRRDYNQLKRHLIQSPEDYVRSHDVDGNRKVDEQDLERLQEIRTVIDRFYTEGRIP